MASNVIGGGALPRLKAAAAVLVAVSVVGLTMSQRGMLSAGLARLDGADPRWLIPAGLCAVLLWLASALTQAGAVGPRLPFPRLCAVQAAASFADHFLPGGSGGFLVNVRFLRRQGLSGPAAATSVVIRSVAGWCIRLPLLIAVLAWHPSYLRRLGERIPAGPWDVLGAVALTGTILAVVLLHRRRRRGGLRRLGELLEGLAVLRVPGKAAALWSGALIAPLLHALVLFAVAQAMDVDLSWVHVLVLYLGVSTLTGMLPLPGVVGALEVVLVAALIAAGVPGSAAAGTTVAYRMVTVWLPLVPAGVLLALLIRRKVV